MFGRFRKKQTAKEIIREIESNLAKEKAETIRRHTVLPVWLRGERLQSDEIIKRGD